MDMVERILEQLKSMPESAQAEVLDFVEYLRSKESRKGEEYEWAQFSLESAMRGIEEEPSPYPLPNFIDNYGITDLNESCEL